MIFIWLSIWSVLCASTCPSNVDGFTDVWEKLLWFFRDVKSNIWRPRHLIELIACTFLDALLYSRIASDAQALKNIIGFLSCIIISPELLSTCTKIMLFSSVLLPSTIGNGNVMLARVANENEQYVEQLLKRLHRPKFTAASAVSKEAVQGKMAYCPTRWSISQELQGELKPIQNSYSDLFPRCWTAHWINACKCGLISTFSFLHKQADFSLRWFFTVCSLDVDATTRCALVPWNANDETPVIWWLGKWSSVVLHPRRQRVASWESWEGEMISPPLVIL